MKAWMVGREGREEGSRPEPRFSGSALQSGDCDKSKEGGGDKSTNERGKAEGTPINSSGQRQIGV